MTNAEIVELLMELRDKYEVFGVSISMCKCEKCFALKARIDAAIESLEAQDDEELIGMVNQHCLCNDKITLDSMCLSANALAMRTLAERGKLIIDIEYWRKVIGHWPVKPEPSPDDPQAWADLNMKMMTDAMGGESEGAK